MILVIFFLLIPFPVFAFLPPEFFVQGLSSVLTVVAGGVAVAIMPFLIFYRFVKNKFKNYKKFIIFLVIQNIIIAVFLGLFFYYKFYKPLYSDSYLFSQSITTDYDLNGQSDIDITMINPNYEYLGGVIRDNNKKIVNYKYGLTPNEINERILSGDNVYFVDVREAEEFLVGHIVDAKNIRYMDFYNDYNKIKNLFSLDSDSFHDSLFILYCHDGNRGLLASERLNMDNIKYLIGGIESLYSDKNIKYIGSPLSDVVIFDKKYQHRFQSLASDVVDFIKNNNAVVVDMRHPPVYNNKHIDESVSLKMSLLTTDEYNNRLNIILANKNKEIILIASRYSELFYANLLIKRLTDNHDFSDNQFHIVFNQFNEFERDTEIRFNGRFNK